MNTMRFHLGDVLSVTTERLLSPDGIDGLYRILNYMTGDKLYTHALPRASRECAPYLQAAFPALAAETASDVTRENWRDWLAAAVLKYGEWFDVVPLPANVHEVIDPISELSEMGVHPDKIITIVVADKP